MSNRTGHSFRQSRKVMIDLGIVLESGEVVHHKDGNARNNDPSNLQVMTRRRHNKLHGRAGKAGVLDNTDRVTVVCPVCQQERQIYYAKTKLSYYTGLCRSCNGKVLGSKRRKNVK